MVRRKTIFYGQSLEEQFNTALGFPEYDRARDILFKAEFEMPKVQWHMIESHLDHEIPQYSRKEIDFAFEAELGYRVRKAVTRELSGKLPEDDISESEFRKKTERIQLLAKTI